jgi:hypothetical protein
MLDHVKRLLSELLPNVEVKQYRKPTPARPAPEGMRRQMMEECDFVIEGLADLRRLYNVQSARYGVVRNKW